MSYWNPYPISLSMTKKTHLKSLYWPLSLLKEILNYSKILRLTLQKSFSWWFCLHLWVWGFCWKNYTKIHMFNQSSNFIHICCQMSCKPCAIQFIKVNMYLNIYYYMYIMKCKQEEQLQYVSNTFRVFHVFLIFFFYKI